MKTTTAQRFGSLGKSFVSPATAPAVIGAALLASDTSDTSETAWSPAAACLLPDVLPVAGTLLSYGGNRQLAAGGTVTHNGDLSLGSNRLTADSVVVSGGLVGCFSAGTWNGWTIYRNQLVGTSAGRISWTNTSDALAGTEDLRMIRVSAGLASVCGNAGLKIQNFAGSADAALTCGAITASGAIQETPTQSALDPTTSNIPSGKRQGWYNSTLSEFRDWVNIGGTLLKSAAYT